jgi:hypothetical protein
MTSIKRRAVRRAAGVMAVGEAAGHAAADGLPDIRVRVV